MTANLFLVGAPRAGTTSLFEYLARHPAVFAPEEKEPHRYDADVLGDRRGMSDDAYRAMYAASAHRWRLDASAFYLYSAQALEAVAGIEGAHAVAVLRDPVELIASWHGLMVATGSEPNRQLAAALDAESAEVPFTRRYTQIARYAQYVERWIAELGVDRVHVLLFEELTGADGNAVSTQLLLELGLDPLELGSFPQLNTYRRPAPLGIAGSSSLRRVARMILPPRLRRRLWWTATAALTPHGERPPVSPAVRERLADELAEDVRRLGVLLGRDLHALWGVDQQPRS